MPSIFAWKQSSPPTPRCQSVTSKKNSKKGSRGFTIKGSESCQRISENKSEDPTSTVADLQFPETTEIESSTEAECASDCAEESDKDSLILELRERLSAILLKNDKLEEEVLNLNEKIRDLDQKNQKLEERLFFFLRNIAASDSLITFYTGFPNYKTMALYEYLNPGASGENINYWLSEKGDIQMDASFSDNTVKQGRPRSLKPLDEFFITLCRLRQGFAELHLAQLFNVSQSTVSRIFITWVNFMYLQLGQINIWPSRELVNETMPEDFKAKYPTTRVIIDCTEVRCEMPSSLFLNSELFSSYKHHTTLKALVGISPGGFFIFTGQLYTGSISDREIVERSGFLKLPLSEGDSVMADKGFTIEDSLPLGVSLNIPLFLGMSAQMPAEDVIATQNIGTQCAQSQ